ncbi:exosortase F system-associated membrane protein [Nonlabens xiamenensis]|uniref:exosortase F system-associated membrane protein n=1 Tax=Nonlabens xiamenensis TaxID=2341043 RepID=UPI000F613D0C|nr:exosortase F system-associated protein [Nonlabens xiamenensis]
MKPKNWYSAAMVVMLVLLLVAVRAFEDWLFVDPLKSYFQAGFQTTPLPEFNGFSLLMFTALRYLVNMVISLWIIWFLFKKNALVAAGLWVYLFAFLGLLFTFIILLSLDSEWGKMALFYVRRFLIHPILLFILVAGFYFFRDRLPASKS